ncbi:DUF397 domain-containing protein [Saccharothrix longispora]|uniref:DUF397 domain-containing protein n=1 Tax=Saccharothrix longispora TaxID=33920 RepID=UPI0028FDA1F5|nr:DUF397 domain-containing protein [Saccharothrix longispora]MBY8849959.1 DUF397 domain-containing protein [Saccharothrix sp. MB29]MDU0288509.1 DUF397 domain-containing protein [Saccharothrix longispora]
MTERDTGWFTSSRSNGGGDQCVECRLLADRVGVRDSKNPGGGALWVGPAAWEAFLRRNR